MICSHRFEGLPEHDGALTLTSTIAGSLNLSALSLNG